MNRIQKQLPETKRTASIGSYKFSYNVYTMKSRPLITPKYRSKVINYTKEILSMKDTIESKSTMFKDTLSKICPYSNKNIDLSLNLKNKRSRH